MEKIIRVGAYDIPVKSTAASLFSYKANFKRDALKDIFSLAPMMEKVGNEKPDEQSIMQMIADGGLDVDVFYRFLWVFAKAKNKDILPLEEWLDTFDVPPLEFMMAALTDVADLLISTVGTTEKSKN